MTCGAPAAAHRASRWDRLAPGRRRRIRFTLDGNGWRFARGHRIVLELLGADAPTYGDSPEPFAAELRDLRVRLPIR
jgi:predicted acyl esterase